MTAKDEVRELIDSLPDDATFEDIQYHIFVRQKVRRGREAALNGDTIPHNEVVERMARWTGK